MLPMRWIAYFILAYVAIALQIGLAPFLRYHGAAPNLVLLAAVFVALNAPRDAALLGCFCLGVLQDLVSQQTPGLFALSYGLTGMLVFAAHQVVYKDHPLAHFTMALLGGLITAAVLLAHGWVHPPSPRVALPGGPVLAAVRLSVATEFTRVAYTAVLAPVVLGLLQRVRKVFAVQPQRRKVRAW
jgi:rod shape-determining protein MreD